MDINFTSKCKCTVSCWCEYIYHSTKFLLYAISSQHCRNTETNKVELDIVSDIEGDDDTVTFY